MDTWPLIREGQIDHVRIDGPFAANTVDAVRAAALAGIGIAMMTYWDVHEQFASGELKEVFLEDARPSELGIWAVYLSRSHLPARVKALVEALRVRLNPTGRSAVLS
jgi:DNA-binding transcriptional LysR family regulator